VSLLKWVRWVVPNLLGGRPGPNKCPWDARDLYAGGVRAVLSVNDGESVDPESLESLGIVYACSPLPVSTPPRDEDIGPCRRVLAEAYRFVEEQLSLGRPTMVHCRAGVGRTGLFLAYYLSRARDLAARSAVAELRTRHPALLDAEGWPDFAVKLLQSRP